MESVYTKNTNFKASRLPSLFSDFQRLEHNNYEGFNANINTWIGVLMEFLASKNRMCWRYDDLVKALEYNKDGTIYKPLGLYMVLNRLVNEEHTIIPVSQYQQFSLSTDYVKESDSGFWNTIAKTIIGKTYSNNLHVFSCTANKNEQFFSLQKLISNCNIIRGKIDRVNDPLTISQLYEISKTECHIDFMEFELCLLYLERDIGVLKRYENIVYLLPVKEEKRTNEQSKKHNKDFEYIAELNYAIHKLKNYNQMKHDEIEKLTKGSKLDVKNGSVMEAKSKLKVRKLTTNQLEKSVNSLERLQILKLKLEDAENNMLMVKTFSTTTHFLSELNKECNEKDIDNLMDKFTKEVDDLSEVGRKLNITVDYDESVEEALEDLQKEVLGSSNKSSEDSNVKEGDSAVNELNEKLNKLKIPKLEPLEKSDDDKDTKQSVLLAE